MKKDLIEGALLPSITLAVKPEYVENLLPLIDSRDLDALAEVLDQPESVNILDGLQRTYILKDLQDEEINFKEGQTVHLEFWIETDMNHLVYRIIVLNAGQKPMSLRHQIELLFATLMRKLEEQIEGLEIFTEKDVTRRSRSRKFALDRIATAYQCFITGSPELKRENLVAQRLIEEDILDSSEADLIAQFDSFVRYLGQYAELDDEICRIYPSGGGRSLPTGLGWWGNETVMNGFFAALSQFSTTEDRKGRIESALAGLLTQLKDSYESLWI